MLCRSSVRLRLTTARCVIVDVLGTFSLIRLLELKHLDQVQRQELQQISNKKVHASCVSYTNT